MAKRGRPPKGFQSLNSDLPELLAVWNRALAAPNGIAVTSAAPRLLAHKLYAARRECGHQAYAGLKVSYTETEVWVVPR